MRLDLGPEDVAVAFRRNELIVAEWLRAQQLGFHGAGFVVAGKSHKLRADAERQRAVRVLERIERVRIELQTLRADLHAIGIEIDRAKIHARTADEVTDKRVIRPQ